MEWWVEVGVGVWWEGQVGEEEVWAWVWWWWWG